MLAGLELSHPTWPGASVANAVVAAGAWWTPLHVLLIVGFAALGWSLWVWSPPTPLSARVLIVAFVACNTAFLAIDGVLIGTLAQKSPVAADVIWNNPLVMLLAGASGATWCAALLGVATRTRITRALALITWIVFVGGSVLPLARLVDTPVAVLTGCVVVYLAGSRAIPEALLILASVTRQHVGSDAAIGMLWIALAQFYRTIRP